ncbi:MAG: hypothetical protein HUJ65_00170 [Oscillospiraceae bacterium]|nr:hypothetical protein [Oscillospiraceae bacterium]
MKNLNDLLKPAKNAMQASANISPSTCRNQMTVECLTLHGSDPAQLLAKFNPNNQCLCVDNPRRAFRGTAPALSTVKQAYGSQTAATWLAIQLFDLAKASGCKDVHDYHDYTSSAALLVSEFGYLKLTELMYFFAKAKTGKYGKFYGSIDFMQIGEALREFQNGERNRLVQEYAQLERDEEQARRAAEHQPITYKEYCKLTNTESDESIQQLLNDLQNAPAEPTA